MDRNLDAVLSHFSVTESAEDFHDPDARGSGDLAPSSSLSELEDPSPSTDSSMPPLVQASSEEGEDEASDISSLNFADASTTVPSSTS